MGKCHTSTRRKGGTLPTSARKVQKHQTKTSVIKHSQQHCKGKHTPVAKHKRTQESTSTSSRDTTESKIQVIEAKPLKSSSLNYYKGYFDDVASFKSIAVLPDGRKVIVGCDYYALLFSADMVKLSRFYMREQPVGVTCYKEDECIVIGKGRFCDEGLFKFHFLKASDSSLMETEHKIKPIYGYKVIAITSCNNKIYALCDTVPPSLKLFAKTRPDPIWSIQTDDDGNALFRNPTCITSFSTKKMLRLVVADRHNDKTVNLVLLDGVQGNILRSEQALFRSVAGLATDKHDNIFICYNNPSAISVLQNDLSNERVVYKSRNLLTNPNSLAYDKTMEQLLVIDNGRTLHTFKLSYK